MFHRPLASYHHHHQQQQQQHSYSSAAAAAAAAAVTNINNSGSADAVDGLVRHQFSISTPPTQQQQQQQQHFYQDHMEEDGNDGSEEHHSAQDDQHQHHEFDWGEDTETPYALHDPTRTDPIPIRQINGPANLLFSELNCGKEHADIPGNIRDNVHSDYSIFCKVEFSGPLTCSKCKSDKKTCPTKYVLGGTGTDSINITVCCEKCLRNPAQCKFRSQLKRGRHPASAANAVSASLAASQDGGTVLEEGTVVAVKKRKLASGAALPEQFALEDGSTITLPPVAPSLQSSTQQKKQQRQRKRKQEQQEQQPSTILNSLLGINLQGVDAGQILSNLRSLKQTTEFQKAQEQQQQQNNGLPRLDVTDEDELLEQQQPQLHQSSSSLSFFPPTALESLNMVFQTHQQQHGAAAAAGIGATDVLNFQQMMAQPAYMESYMSNLQMGNHPIWMAGSSGGSIGGPDNTASAVASSSQMHLLQFSQQQVSSSLDTPLHSPREMSHPSLFDGEDDSTDQLLKQFGIDTAAVNAIVDAEKQQQQQLKLDDATFAKIMEDLDNAVVTSATAGAESAALSIPESSVESCPTMEKEASSQPEEVVVVAEEEVVAVTTSPVPYMAQKVQEDQQQEQQQEQQEAPEEEPQKQEQQQPEQPIKSSHLHQEMLGDMVAEYKRTVDDIFPVDMRRCLARKRDPIHMRAFQRVRLSTKRKQMDNNIVMASVSPNYATKSIRTDRDAEFITVIFLENHYRDQVLNELHRLLKGLTEQWKNSPQRDAPQVYQKAVKLLADCDTLRQRTDQSKECTESGQMNLLIKLAQTLIAQNSHLMDGNKIQGFAFPSKVRTNAWAVCLLEEV